MPSDEVPEADAVEQQRPAEFADRQPTVEEYVLDDPERSGTILPVTLGLYASPDELTAPAALETFLSRTFSSQRTALAPPGQMSSAPSH